MASRIGANRMLIPSQYEANDDDASSSRVEDDDSSLIEDSDSNGYGHADSGSRNAVGDAASQAREPAMYSVPRTDIDGASWSMLSGAVPEGLNGQHPKREPCCPGGSCSDDIPDNDRGPDGSHTTRLPDTMTFPSSPQTLRTGPLASGRRSSPVLIVRTYSVRAGRKPTYRVQSTTSITAANVGEGVPLPGRSISMRDVKSHRVTDRKSLRVQVAKLLRPYPEVCIDLSFNWTDFDQTSGARTALVTNLLAGGRGKKLSIDLSNRRLSDLRKGAQMRNQKKLAPREWRKAIVDSEATALVEALRKELQRVGREQEAMPEFGLVCHDQPLAGVAYPLVKTLAAHAAVLGGLTRLDLNRYSRSAEVGEAWPASVWTGSADADTVMEKYAVRLAMLLATTHSLRELCLRLNGLTSIDLATLMVSGNATLARLDLSCNPVCRRPDGERSLKGVRELVRHLRKDSGLVDLDLSFCGIDGEAAALLMNGLKAHPSLERLHLAGNPIPPKHPIFADRRVSVGPGMALHQ